MVQNWDLMKSSHYRIFKCISFMLSHYISAIDLDVASSFNVFSEFDFIPQSNILSVLINNFF